MTMNIRFAQIEPTTRCNFTCGFCAGRHMNQAELDPAVFEAFLSTIDGLEHIELQGEGEPLLHPQFFELVRMARRRFPDVSISIISNGSLFSEKNIDGILGAGMTKLFVSMESADATRFQQIRGGKLERVKGGILALLAERARRRLTLPVVGLAVTVLRSTVDETFDSIAPLYRELGLDGGIVVQYLQAMPQYAQYYSDATRAELCGQDEAYRFKTRLQASPEVGQLLDARGQTPGFYERLYSSTDGRPVCPWLENGVFLANDGSIASCCFIKDTDRFRIGRVGDSSDEIDFRRRQMSAQLAAGQVPPACAGCGVASGIVSAVTAAETKGAGT